jgi:hypothetical protein
MILTQDVGNVHGGRLMEERLLGKNEWTLLNQVYGVALHNTYHAARIEVVLSKSPGAFSRDPARPAGPGDPTPTCQLHRRRTSHPVTSENSRERGRSSDRASAISPADPPALAASIRTKIEPL